MVQRPRPDLRGGVRSNAHSYRNWGEGLGNDPSYPALHRNLGTACTSLAWCCCSVDLAVIDLSTILKICHNILIYRNYHDEIT